MSWGICPSRNPSFRRCAFERNTLPLGWSPCLAGGGGDLGRRAGCPCSRFQGVCEINAKWMVLSNLCLAVALVAGAFGLTASAYDLPSAVRHEPGHPFIPLAYGRVEIPEAGLSLDVPIGWQQLDQEPAWSPTGNGETRIGISWFHLLPSIKPEGILLPGGLMVTSAPIALDWGSGRQYMVSDYGTRVPNEGASAPPLSVEIHAIVTVVDGETRWVYDLHAVGPSEEELAALKPVLDTMLGSMYLSAPTAD
jgi:hypothetical protein